LDKEMRSDRIVQCFSLPTEYASVLPRCSKLSSANSGDKMTVCAFYTRQSSFSTIATARKRVIAGNGRERACDLGGTKQSPAVAEIYDAPHGSCYGSCCTAARAAQARVILRTCVHTQRAVLLNFCRLWFDFNKMWRFVSTFFMFCGVLKCWGSVWG